MDSDETNLDTVQILRAQGVGAAEPAPTTINIRGQIVKASATVRDIFSSTGGNKNRILRLIRELYQARRLDYFNTTQALVTILQVPPPWDISAPVDFRVVEGFAQQRKKGNV